MLLKGKPYYLRLALDQGCYPDGLYTGPSDSAMKSIVEAVRELGLNGVRKTRCRLTRDTCIGLAGSASSSGRKWAA